MSFGPPRQWQSLASAGSIMEMDAAELLIGLHGRVLRQCSAAEGVHFQGLAVAGRYLHKSQRVDKRLKKQMEVLDQVVAWLRHATAPGCAGMLKELTRQLGLPAHGAVVADLEKEIQAEDVDEKHAQSTHETSMPGSQSKQAQDSQSFENKEGTKAELETHLQKQVQEHASTLEEDHATATTNKMVSKSPSDFNDIDEYTKYAFAMMRDNGGVKGAKLELLEEAFGLPIGTEVTGDRIDENGDLWVITSVPGKYPVGADIPLSPGLYKWKQVIESKDEDD